MTVSDLLRAARPGSDTPGTGSSWWEPGWRRAGLIGVATAVVSLLLVLGPVWLAWQSEVRSTADLPEALRMGTSLWLLAGGGHLAAGDATLSLVPLLAFGALVLLARLGVREAMVRVSTDGEHWAGLLPRPLAEAAGAWCAGYTAVGVVAALVARSGAFPPRMPSLVLPLLAVPVLALGLALRQVARDDPEVLGPRLARVLPESVRRGLAPGLQGAVLLVLLGAVVVAVAVGVSWPRVSSLDAGLAAGSTGGALLWLAQLSALPNLALWVVSLLAGPGFSVVQGASVSWSGAESGLLPLVPVLGALPQPGPFPVVVAVLGVAVMVLVGGWIGTRALGTLARLSRLRTKLVVALCACGWAALAVGLLDALGGGSAGQFRLSQVGAPALILMVVVFGELAVGAVVVVLRDAWRVRR